MKKQGLAIRHLTLLYVLLAIVLFATGSVMAVEVGEQAPDFSLPSTIGEKISLGQFKGKKHVLLQFYTMDFNPT